MSLWGRINSPFKEKKSNLEMEARLRRDPFKDGEMPSEFLKSRDHFSLNLLI